MRAAEYYPVIVITGPRQSGKSTLCRHLFDGYSRYNFEDVSLRQRVAEDPKAFLANAGAKVVIDEVQQVPELFSYLQIEVDENPDRQFILTGSSNFSLMERITQSLAGRAALFNLLPFALNELGDYKQNSTDHILLNGLYPSVVTKARPVDLFYSNYYSTYVERDVRQIKNINNVAQFQRFIQLAAGRIGTEFNATSLAMEVGVSAPTISSWISILQTSYVVLMLQPFHANINKRLTKSPKLYFYDTGLACFLLGIETVGQLAVHPLRGSIFENLAVVELIKESANQGKRPNLFFYRENAGREADMLQIKGDKIDIYEVKSASTYNPSFQKNLKYLNGLFPDMIGRKTVVYDGDNIPPDIINIRDLAK
ncbi:MAG: ATP-binding protein [Muribaculaceae bacterium]|nr:ATP-binding protein [Muribaculaceae bacterium]